MLSLLAAATITGHLTDLSLSPLNTKLLFTPTNEVLVNAQGLSAGPPKIIDTTNGAFTTTLDAGDYTVALPLISTRKPFSISVPDTADTLNITNLLNTPRTYIYTNRPSSSVDPVLTSGTTSIVITNQNITNLLVNFLPGTNTASLKFGDDATEQAGNIFWNPYHSGGAELQLSASALSIGTGCDSVAPFYRQNRRIQLGIGPYHHAWVDLQYDARGDRPDDPLGYSIPLRWTVGYLGDNGNPLFPAIQGVATDTSGHGALVFYDNFDTFIPNGSTNWIGSPVRGRMLIGQGWDFRGKLIEQRATATITTSTYALDFNGPQCTDLLCVAPSVAFHTANTTGAPTNSETRTFIIRSGATSPTFTWPADWAVLGPPGATTVGTLPASMSQGHLLHLTLRSVGPGEANIIACAQLATDSAFAWHPDAQDFFDRAGTLSTLEKTAVNTLVTDLKQANLWSRMYALYPFVGSAATPCAQNLVSENYTLLFSPTGLTFDATGITGDGINGHADTQFNPRTSATPDNLAFGAYIHTLATSATAEYISAVTDTDGLTRLTLGHQGDLAYYSAAANNSGLILGPPSAPGLAIVTRPTTTGFLITHNTTIQSAAATSGQPPNTTLYLLDRNYNGTSGGKHANATLSLAFISQGLTSTDCLTLNTIITRFTTTLSR